MIQRADRLHLQIHVSFEMTRFGPQHLMKAYACLVPIVRRTSLQSKHSNAHGRKDRSADSAGKEIQRPKAATTCGGEG